jgi:serine/threonine protein kinase
MAFCCIRHHINAADTMWCDQCESLVAGTMINDFKVISYIGNGSLSSVYLAEQQSLNGRKVVIKILQQPWDQLHADSFQREAELLASLSHPYILPVYAFGILYEQYRSPNISTQFQASTLFPYLVLPYVEQGSTAEAFIREGKRPWPIDRVVPIMQDVAEALDYAHSRGVLHRDVKPANLLQMGSHVLLADFSVASMIDANMSHLHAPWAGSPAYMAPEVWALAPGRYSDQYALAITCFYLLTGAYPWRHLRENSVREWLNLHRNVMPCPLCEFRPDLPPGVSAVLQRALHKDPHERYPTVQAFAADLFTASREETRRYGNYAAANARSAAHPLYSLPVGLHAGGKEWREAIPAGIFTPDLKQATLLSEPDTVPMDLIKNLENVVEQEDAAELVSGESLVDMGDLAGTGPAMSPISDAALNFVRSDSDGVIHPPANKWLWWTLLLNVLICVLLAAEAGWQFGDVSAAGNVFLTLWPGLMIGLAVAHMYRSVPSNSLCWCICWGALFGVTDIVLSGLVCYAWTALALTIPHWGYDWLQAGDGLRIFVVQIKLLLPEFLRFFVLGSWVAVGGGALIGFFLSPGHFGSERQ